MTSTMNPPQPRLSSDYSKIFESKFFWGALVILLFALPLGISFMRPRVQQLPILGSIGEFSLINQDGRPFTSNDLQGSVLLVNFVFTRCPDVCPLLTDTMSKVQDRLRGTGKSIQLLTVTVDPEFDQPAVLKAFAKKHNADFSTWSFLTGPKADIRTFVVDRFATPLVGAPKGGDANDMGAAFEIAHAEQFVIVDQLGRIRSYQAIKSSDDINRALREMAIIVNTPPKS